MAETTETSALQDFQKEPWPFTAQHPPVHLPLCWAPQSPPFCSTDKLCAVVSNDPGSGLSMSNLPLPFISPLAVPGSMWES